MRAQDHCEFVSSDGPLKHKSIGTQWELMWLAACWAALLLARWLTGEPFQNTFRKFFEKKKKKKSGRIFQK